MTRRRNTVTPFSRDYRRPPRWGMGLPRSRPPRSRPPARRDLAGGALRLLLTLILTLGLAPVLGDAANGFMKPAEGCRVLTIVDGDTVRMLCPGLRYETARLTGFDTPEITSPACPSEFARGIGATFYLRWQLWTAGRVTTVAEGQDRYGRTLTALFLDGEPVARRMIAGGWAHPYGGGPRGGWCG